MSDPMHDRNTPPPPQGDPPPRKGSSPLIWILLLIALIAFGWYYYNRQGARETIGDITPPPATSDAMTPAESTPADEAAADAAATREARKRAPRPERARSREAALLERPRPSYPPEAYRAGEEGTVVVLAQVDANGDASDVKVVERSGSRVLDRAAINEVRRWKFRPAMENGKAVASAVKVPVDYRLDDER